MKPPSKWVRLNVPSRFRMGPARMAQVCGWQTRQEGNDLLVCVEERYRPSRPRLLHPLRLADSSNASYESTYEPLGSWPTQDEFRGEWAGAAEAEVERRLASKEIEQWLYGWQILMLTAPDAEIPRLVRESFSGTVLANFPNASLWTVGVEPRYHWRFTLVHVLFGALETPELLERSAEEFKGFPAGRELASSTFFGLDALLEPALMAAAPWLLGVASMRLGGSVVVLFGQPIAGVRDTPVPELIQLYRPRISTKDALPTGVLKAPELDEEAVGRFFRWWVERLNDLFGVVLDPARFTDGAGTHDPRVHFGTLLSLERLFGSLQALLAATYRDEFARRTLLFDILDLLEGLRFGDFRTLLSLSRAKAALERVRSHGAGATLPAMTKCEAAVEALEGVGDGFYLQERRTDTGLLVRNKRGSGGRSAWRTPWQTICACSGTRRTPFWAAQVTNATCPCSRRIPVSSLRACPTSHCSTSWT